MKSQIKKILNKHPAKQYLLACSGGLDSMVLLHLMNQLSMPILVLHVNYHLRGEESNNDAQFIESYCNERSIPIEILDIDLNLQLKNYGGNLQNEARKIRYDFFKQKLLLFPDSLIVTAHHLEDQLETFWLQLVRGSGLSGMSGMKMNDGKIFRPFLQTSKKEIKDFAEKEKITWREDSSNQNIKYFRNFLRLKALPYLHSEMPSINQHVLLLQNIFQNELDIQMPVAVNLSEKWQATHRMDLVDINVSSIAFLEALKLIGVPPALMDAICNLKNAEKGKRVLIKKPSSLFHKMIREKDFISLENHESSTYFTFTAIKSNKIPLKFDLLTWYLDEDLLAFPLEMRPWKQGDKIQPIGLKGTKKINDLLKDKLVPYPFRETYPVVICGDAIVGLPGLIVSKNFIAGPKTINILKVTFTKC